MSADPILYCLERLTDYRQFERLATDLMARTEFPNIEPIGGTGDGGRDALYCNDVTGKHTVFAYSVRADWEAKLQEDCRRISELATKTAQVVFVSTQEISARKKDHYRTRILDDYGWQLDFYDIERIRTLLNGPLHELLGRHPSIFVAPWFERRGGQLITHEQRDLVLVDHLPADHGFANWLFRRLSLMGYSVWCHGHAPLAGENADASVRALINHRAARYLPILSADACQDADFMGRIAVATGDPDLTIPCWLSDLESQSFAAPLRRLTPARFFPGWKQGLMQAAQQLEHSGVPKPLECGVRQGIALKAYMTEPLVKAEAEQLYTNEFRVSVPSAIHAYTLRDQNEKPPDSLRREWAYDCLRGKVFSFAPNSELSHILEPNPTIFSWRDYPRYPPTHGIDTERLVKMLVKRSLLVACIQAGFQYCNERKLCFLDENKRTLHGYEHVDGRRTNVSLTGERSWGFGLGKDKFRYQLSPIFAVRIDEQGAVWAWLRLYVRLTDKDGLLLPRTKILSRRKRVTRMWWNKEWFQRTLGMMQVIAGKRSGINGEIVVGDGTNAVRVNVSPVAFESPVAIDVEALDRVGDHQAEVAAARFSVEEGETNRDMDA